MSDELLRDEVAKAIAAETSNSNWEAYSELKRDYFRRLADAAITTMDLYLAARLKDVYR